MSRWLRDGRGWRTAAVAVLVAGAGVLAVAPPPAASASAAAVGAAATPGPPASVTAAARDEGALVSWAPPASTGGSPVTAYVIKATPGGKTMRTQAVTSFLVGGLVNGTAYSFTVAAVNASGKGPAAGPSAAVTPRAPKRPGRPRSVVAAAGFEQAAVSWEAPAWNGGAPVTGYRLTTRPATKAVRVGGSARSATLTGLADGTAYQVSVAAVNSAGAGKPAWSATVTPNVTVPAAPASVTAAPVAGGAVQVGWSPPLSDGGSALTQYVISVAGTAVTATAQPSATSVKVTGLTAGQSYTFAVAAENAQGEGPSGTSAPATSGASRKPHTVVLWKGSLAALTTVGTDGSLLFDHPTTQVSHLIAGDVVVAGVSPATPDGLLAKITSVSTSGSAVTLGTVPASLDQALKTAGFGTSAQLARGQVAAFTPARPGVQLLPQAARPASASPGSITLGLNTTLYQASNGGKVAVHGNVSLTPAMSFHASISCCFHTASTFDATDTAAASLGFTADVNHSFSGSYTLGTFRFKPITFDVAGVPVVIVPTLTVKLIAQGTVQAGLASSAGASVTIGVDATTKDSTVSAHPVFTRTANFTPPTLYGSLSAAGGAEADLSATVDGVAGATLTDKLWLAELSADISKTPWWTLSAENVLSLNLNLSLLHHSFAHYNKTLSDRKVLLAEASDPYQAITITPSPASVTPGGTLQLKAQVAGAAAQKVNWSVPAGNGAITSGGLYTAPSSPGIYHIDALQPAAGLKPAAYGVAAVQVGYQPPGPPTAPEATSTTYATATLSWKPPADTGGGAITGYTVTAYPGGATYPVLGAATSDTIGGLTPGATYTFTVTATGDGGDSLPSAATSPVEIDNVGGAAWTAAEAPVPAKAAVGGDVYTDTGGCLSATSCVVTGGYYDTSGDSQGMLLSGAGGSWTPVEAPLPRDAAANPDPIFLAQSCSAAAGCVVVGNYNNTSGDNETGLLLTGSGSSWTALKPPPPPAPFTDAMLLDAVACSSSCVAVGSYVDSSGNSEGVLLTGSGSSWATNRAPLPAGAASDPLVSLSAVACPSWCVAVGSYTDTKGRSQGLLLTDAGGSWTAAKAPLPPSTYSNPFAFLGAVGCSPAGSCAATGGYTDGSYADQGLLLTSSDGVSWTAAKAPLPANASSDHSGNSLGPVACPSASTCVAVGDYGDKSGNLEGEAVSGSGSSWTATQTPLPANAATHQFVELDSVVCPPAAPCVVGGYYTGQSGNNTGLLLTGSGSSWEAAEPALPAGAAASQDFGLSAANCPDASVCVAIGGYTDTAGVTEGLIMSGPG